MTKKVKRTPQQQLTRKQRSRLQKERHMRRILIGGVGIVGLLIVGVLGYGVVAERIIGPREPVAIVDETPITTGEFEARVKFRRLQLQNQLGYLYQQQQTMAEQASESDDQSLQDYFQQQINSLQSQLAAENAEALGQQVLDQMIQEELVRQEAERRGINITAEEVQGAVHENFGYTPDATPPPAESPPVTSTESMTASQPTPAPTPTQMTEADFREMYNRYMQEGLKPLGISEQQYRSWIKASLLIEELQADMMKELPQQADQVKLRFISVDSEDRARDIVQRLDEGADWDALLEEVQADEEEAPGSGSELDWMPEDTLANQLGEEIADTIFDLAVGEHTEPVRLGEESQALYIFEVVGREERQLEANLLEQMAQEAFQSWLESQQSLVERRSIEGKVPTRP